MNNGSVILDEVLSESRVETLNVGPTNVSVHFIVNQSPPDYRDIGVGVSMAKIVRNCCGLREQLYLGISRIVAMLLNIYLVIR